MSHAAVAATELGEQNVLKAIEDPAGARLRPETILAMTLVRKLTLDVEAVGPDDMTPLRKAGVVDSSIEDVIVVCAAFNCINRVADALEFAEPAWEAHVKAAPMMLKRGYRLP